MDIHLRIVPHEPLDVGRQIMQPDAINGGHANVAGDDVLDLLHPAVDGVVGLEHPFAVVVKHFALRGEPEVLLAPLDKQRLEMPLQRADRLADRRLADAVDLRGLGEAFGLGQVAEYFKAFKLHKGIEQ